MNSPSLGSSLVEVNKWLTDNLDVVVPRRGEEGGREMSRDENKDENVAAKLQHNALKEAIFPRGNPLREKRAALNPVYGCFSRERPSDYDKYDVEKLSQL